MHIRVITLAFQESVGGFSERALEQALAGKELIDVTQHFFKVGGRPFLTLVCKVSDGGVRPFAGSAAAEDPSLALPDDRQALYRDLRRWRNDRAKAEGVPAYLVFRNGQLAEICRRLPASVAELREIEGIGEQTCRKYGADVLALVKRAAETSAAGPPRSADGPAGESGGRRPAAEEGAS